MHFQDILTDNFVFLYELVGLFILLSIGVHISDQMKKLTRMVVILMALETVFFYVERWTQTLDHVILLRPLMTAAVYSTYPVILILMMQITTTAFSRKKLLLLLIPEIISIPLFFTSQWTHLICFFHEPNIYEGGPLSWWPYILFALYLIVFAVQNFLFFRKSDPADQLAMAFILLVPIVGVLYYLLSDSGRDYNAILISATLLYYIYIYIHKSKIDPLTSLQNRQSYYQAIHSGNRPISGVVSVDMNDLKVLNDSFGHEAGDKALRSVSDVMREYCGSGGAVFRVGGDEFMILYYGVSEEQIKQYVAKMREKMAETTYMCAFGYSMTRPDATIEDTIRESDEKMYADKARMKTGRS